MGDTEGSIAAVNKRQYRNNTLGWLGVVVLDPMGKPTGISIEPQGVCWLSDAEAILTARAPKRPEDNPFEEKIAIEVQTDGSHKEIKMRPLVPISEGRYVPQEDRYLPPSILGNLGDPPLGAAQAAATAEEPTHHHVVGGAALAQSVEESIVAEVDPATVIPPMEQPAPVVSPPLRTEGGTATQSAQPPANTPPGGQEGPDSPAQSADPAATSWTEPPDGQPTATGELGGENVEETAAGDGPSPAAPPTAEPAAAPDNATVVPPSDAPASTEETAAQAEAIGEETGAAAPPAGDPPAGEFASHEETGTPDPAGQTPSE